MNYGTQYFGGSGSLGKGSGTGVSMQLPQRLFISPGISVLGTNQANPGVVAVTTANTAMLNPFFLPGPAKLTGISYVTGASAGTVDIGVYSDLGNLGTTASRIFTSGALAPGVGLNTVAVPGITLAGGDQRYFTCITGSTVTTLSIVSYSLNPSLRIQLVGCFLVVGAGPTLGASLTLAAITNTLAWPLIGLDFKAA